MYYHLSHIAFSWLLHGWAMLNETWASQQTGLFWGNMPLKCLSVPKTSLFWEARTDGCAGYCRHIVVGVHINANLQYRGTSQGGVDMGGMNWQGQSWTLSTCTNHRNRGRTSADRSTKATLMLTVPRSLTKSSTKDLTWPSLEIVFRHTYAFKAQRCQGVVLIRDYCYSGNSGQGGYQPCQHGFWLRGVQS